VFQKKKDAAMIDERIKMFNVVVVSNAIN